jgi:hypothetical protein
VADEWGMEGGGDEWEGRAWQMSGDGRGWQMSGKGRVDDRDISHITRVGNNNGAGSTAEAE